MTDASAPEQLTRVEFVVAGVVVLTDNTLGVTLYELSNDRIVGTKRHFGKEARKALRGTPGTVYTIETNADRSALDTSTAKYARRWKNAEQSALWEAASRTIEADVAAAREQKKGEKHSALLKSLETARKAYGQSIAGNRQQLLAIMVEYITRY